MRFYITKSQTVLFTQHHLLADSIETLPKIFISDIKHGHLLCLFIFFLLHGIIAINKRLSLFNDLFISMFFCVKKM